jgi:hypothetical protein
MSNPKKLSWSCEKPQVCHIESSEQETDVELWTTLESISNNRAPWADEIEVIWTPLSSDLGNKIVAQDKKSSPSNTTKFKFRFVNVGWYRIEAIGYHKGKVVGTGKKDVQLIRLFSHKQEKSDFAVHHLRLIPIGEPANYRIRLYDNCGSVMPMTYYEANIGGEVRTGITDQSGVANLTRVIPFDKCLIHWGRYEVDQDSHPGIPYDFLYQEWVHMLKDSDTDRASLQKRLSNMGYRGNTIAEPIDEPLLNDCNPWIIRNNLLEEKKNILKLHKELGPEESNYTNDPNFHVADEPYPENQTQGRNTRTAPIHPLPENRETNLDRWGRFIASFKDERYEGLGLEGGLSANRYQLKPGHTNFVFRSRNPILKGSHLKVPELTDVQFQKLDQGIKKEVSELKPFKYKDKKTGEEKEEDKKHFEDRKEAYSKKHTHGIYTIFIPAHCNASKLRITLAFMVGTEMHRHGLRHLVNYSKDVDALIVISGYEKGWDYVKKIRQ